MDRKVIEKRASGVLLHITSLPSPSGIGDLGREAYRFADFLAQARQSYWQVLPLNPTGPTFTNSPYNSESPFAGNPILLGLGELAREGLLTREDIPSLPKFPEGRVDYQAVVQFKRPLLQRAFERFRGKKEKEEFEQFCEEHRGWMEDYALFIALQESYPGMAWCTWPPELRDRRPEALTQAVKEHAERIEKEKFLQFIFFRQWSRLKKYCNERGIRIIGDMSMYPDYHSTDVWAHPEMFKLTEEKFPEAISGVPPDYFSETGQLWGNPVYRWDVLQESNYRWWVSRIRHSFELYDLVRIDHFRGFAAYWEVPAGETVAVNGKWMPGPGEDFFRAMGEQFSEFPVIAEDLGVITEDVIALRNKFGLPGMKILLFAFGDDYPRGSYVPPNLEENSVVYTGTHDNNTVLGWFEKDASEQEKANLFIHLGREILKEEVCREFVRMAMESKSDLAMIPMQDILGLGGDTRMNRPATIEGNYRWRLAPGQASKELEIDLREITCNTNRA